MKITEREQAERKNRIIHVAFRLFCRDGIDNVSIRDVAKQAGVGEKSIYRYFVNKTELVLGAVVVLWKEIVSELISSLDGDYMNRSGLEQVGCILNCMGRLFENYAPYIFFSYESRTFLARHNARITEEQYADELQSIEKLYTDAIKKGRQDGSIGATENAEDLYFAVWGVMRGYVGKIVMYDRMYAGLNMWRSRFALVRDLLLRGLRESDGTGESGVAQLQSE